MNDHVTCTTHLMFDIILTCSAMFDIYIICFMVKISLTCVHGYLMLDECDDVRHTKMH
jgi:hypothetical protein